MLRCLPIAALMLWPTLCLAQHFSATDNGLIDSRVARRYGLERTWMSQLQVDPRTGKMADMTLHVSSTEATAVFEIMEGDRVLELITDKQLDPFGRPLGRDGAQMKASKMAAGMKQRGIDARVESRDVPDILLAVVSTRGVVQAIDSQTGRTRWTTRVGRSEYPTSEVSVSDKYVAVLNGVSLYLLNRSNGDIVWTRKIDGVPAAGPVLAKRYAFIVSFEGMMQCFDLDDFKQPPFKYQSYGRAVVQPVVTPRSVVWPTDRGHFYVAPSQRPGINFRIEADQPAVAPAAYQGPWQLYMTATDGYVYCVHELSGGMIWSFPLGEPVSKAPVVIGDSLYIVTDENNLYRMHSKSGESDTNWWQRGITQFVARTATRLYCLDTLNRLVVLDVNSGGRVATLPVANLEIVEANHLTDRILLASHNGQLQSLREIGSRWPTIHLGAEEEAPPTPGAPPADGKKPGPVPDPFGGGAPAAPAAAPGGVPDPFGGGAAPAGGGAPDPFGGRAPPAGGGAPDPFGGGAPPAGGGAPDPFGGGAPPAGGGAPDPFGGGAPPAGGGGGNPNPFK